MKKWHLVAPPFQGKTKLYYDPERDIVKTVTYTDGYPLRTKTRYRRSQCSRWVEKIADLGPAEPEYQI